MYDRNVRRRRAVLALLVAVSLILLTVSFGDSAGGPLRTIQRGMLEVLSPVQEGASWALKPVRDLAGWIGDTWDAKGERDRLERERDELRRAVIGAEQARRENAELRRMVGLDREAELDTYEPVSARVIGRSPTVWYATITIDEGSDAGIAVDQPVVNGQGLVGKVREVSPGAAQVTLITDSTSAVSAKVAATGVTGLVRPAVGQPDDLLLDFVRKASRVSRGQAIVTAGSRSDRLESLFPPGIPIGSVSRVDDGELDLYRRVHIRPYADVRRLEFVQVLTKPQATPSVQASVAGGAP